MASLLEHFAQSVENNPQRIAIVDGKGRETSFAQLQSRSTQLAAYWQSKGIAKGDRVLIAMPLDADLYASLAALWSLGAVVVLSEPAMGLAGLRHAARTTKVKGFCASGLYCALKYALPELWSAELLRPNAKGDETFNAVTPADDDIALISFTSGTTGKPKAIPRSHGFLMAQHKAISPLLFNPESERDLVAFPVFTLINIANGQTSILPNWKMSKLAKLSSDQLGNWIKAQNISRALLPPSLCEKLTNCSLPTAFHTIFTGGGPVFPDLLAELQNGRDHLRIVCVYGSTEAEPIAHLDAADIGTNDKDAMSDGHGLLAGLPVDDIRIRIEEHEIQVTGDHVNKGYLNPMHDTENKVRDGDTIWHRTGDAGTFDDKGRLWLWGRIGTEVPVDGTPIFPFCVEVAARQWEGLEHCALMLHNDQAVLVIQGNTDHKSTWASKSRELGITQMQVVANIPMDKRHASKVDRVALQKILGAV